MAIIYSFPEGTPTLSDTVLGTQFDNNGNPTKSFSISDIIALVPSTAGFVPYTGATQSVDLGAFDLTATSIIKAGGTSVQYLMADGSTSTAPSLTGFVPYVGATQNVNLGSFNLTATSIVKAGGTNLQFLMADGSVTTLGGGVTSVTGTAPIVSSGGANPAISIPLGTSSVDGYLSAIDRTNFETAYTNRITSLTTTGTGAATLVANVLNIPTPIKSTYIMTGVFANMFGGDPGGSNKDILEWSPTTPNVSHSSVLPILQNCRITAAGFKWISSTAIGTINPGDSWTVNLYKMTNPLTDSTTADGNFTLAGSLNITLTSVDSGTTPGIFSSSLNLVLAAGDIIRIAGNETGTITTSTEEAQLSVLFEVI